MATYEIGEEVQFVRQVTRANPDRVINIDEKASITAIAPDGSYTVKLLSGDLVSGITDDSVEPSFEMPGDSVPTANQLSGENAPRDTGAVPPAPDENEQ